MNKVKKIISVVFLLSIGFGAFANNKLREKSKIKPNKIVIYTVKSKAPTTQWQVTVRCGSLTITSCCYSSSTAATNAGWEIYDNLNCSDMPS
jgi:hypothetical protein